ncbi:MAG TPA: hypothetical protein PKL81_13940 [Ferruginibacter sp.]|nr:hypothetical protein [Ferruginibacter sp.]
MKKMIIILAVNAAAGVLSSCGNKAKEPAAMFAGPVREAASAGYRWTEHTPNAAFPKSYNFQLFSVQDTLWAFHPLGNWYSRDGKEWIKSALPNSIDNLAFLDYVQFNNSILGLGYFKGNIEHFQFRPTIYQTTDMVNWKILADESNLPHRFFYHPFVFLGKIWIIGGTDGNRSFADVWNSPDGVHWTKQADNLPFGERNGSQFVVLNSRVYMINNDVWSSADGLNWVQEAKELVSGENIHGYTAAAFDGRIWLLGCNRNAKFKSEILFSEDGKKWSSLAAPWSPRGGIAACVYNDRLFITGGKYGGPGIDGQTEFIYSNDVWSMRKTEH